MADDRWRDEWYDWNENRDPNFREAPWRGDYRRDPDERAWGSAWRGYGAEEMDEPIERDDTGRARYGRSGASTTGRAYGPRSEEWPAPPYRGAEPGRGAERGWWDRARDEMRSWMGDEEANRRREMDSYRTWRNDPDYASARSPARSPTGRGPRGYTRSDSRILEDVSDRLGYDWDVDATDIAVRVNNGEVTLDGTVDSRAARRRAEYLAAGVWGVRDVQNNLRVRERTWRSGNLTGSSSAALEQTTGMSSGTRLTATKPPTH